MKYQGVYDNRVQGLYDGKLVLFDEKLGYLIGDPNLRKPTRKESIDINGKFGGLEKKLKSNK